jgi:hypothetical protein
LAEPLVPQPGNRELHLLDLELADAHLRLGTARLRFGLHGLRFGLYGLGLHFPVCGLGGDHHRLERRGVVGKGIRSGWHAAIAAHIADLARANR